MSSIKRIIKRRIQKLLKVVYSKFDTSHQDDPLYGQRLYAFRTLKEGCNTLDIVKCSPSTLLSIDQLWGSMNGWFDFYNTVGDGSNTHLYFPLDWFYDYVDAKLNNWKICKELDDKCLYDFFFYDVDRPVTLAVCLNGQWLDANYQLTSLDKVSEICKAATDIIIKPSVNSSGGHGISFWNKDGEPIEELLTKYKDCIVQRIIEQHPDLSCLHPQSINSVRIMTMLLDGEVRILSSVLRVGIGESRVDNISSGGVVVGIDKDGCLRQRSFSAKGQSWDGLPNGLVTKGRRVPAYSECLRLCEKVVPRFARFSRLISWDFAIDRSEKPLLVEANLYGGGLNSHQMCNGPIFGDEESTKEMITRFFKTDSI